jgi:succinate dehydrogenase flavin-adding protein (antitoxin of CptAB toxin-antitoxin module)
LDAAAISFSSSFCCSHIPFYSLHFTSLSLAESHSLLQHFFSFLETCAHNLYNWITEHNFHEKLKNDNLAVLPNCLLGSSA